MRDVPTKVAVMAAAVCVSACAVAPAEPQIEVGGVTRVGACSVPLKTAAIDFTSGPVTIRGTLRWDGGVRAGSLSTALEPAAVRERFVIPEGKDLDALTERVNAKIVATFPHPTAAFEYTARAGEVRGVFEPRCTYRIDLQRADRTWSVDLTGGSGRWEIGVVNSGGGYEGPVPGAP